MSVRIIIGDVRQRLADLPSESVDCCVTSPPYYGLRDYGVAGQIGLEETPDAYIQELVNVFREVRRVLKSNGTLWLNLGDSYAGGGNYRGVNSEDSLTSKQRSNRGARGVSQLLGAKNTPGCKPKDLLMIPARVALALQADGWWLRSEIIWAKPNPMPESVTDRPTSSHEKIYLLSKAERYYFDADAVKETVAPSSMDRAKYPRVGHAKDVYGDGKTNLRNPKTDEASRNREIESGERNIRNVWTIATQPYSEAHFATFPPALIEPCIKAGCPKGGTVLDPFGGAGTTGLVADRLERSAILVELNPEYAAMAEKRIRGDAPLFAEVAA
jgi:DNA modification methylase